MKTLYAIALVILGMTVRAQTIKEATWVASVEQEVRNIHDTQLNVPVIETKSNNLFGLEPTTGEILWKIPLKSPVSTFDAFDGTPFTLLDSAMLIDLSTGKTIDLNSLIKGKLRSCYIIPESYDLVLYSKGPDYILVIDLFNFAVRWNMRSDFSDKPGQTTKSKFAGAFAQIKDNSNQSVMLGLECPPISNKSGGLIVAAFGKIVNIDAQGKVVWQVEQPKKKKSGLIKVVDNQTELLVDDKLDQFYILKSKLMTAMKISDGSVIWPEFYEVKGDKIIDTDAGLIPVSTTDGNKGGMFSKSKLNLVDYSSGKAVWAKELELQGVVDQYQVLGDGNLAVVTYNQTNSKFQIVDVKQGRFRYADEIKLKGRVTNFMMGKDKALFATSKGINIIDLNNGNDLLPKMQKFENDADIVTVYRGPLVYNIDVKNRKVFKTDLLADQSSVIIRDFKFESGEQLEKYDVLENGNIFLGSAHHLQTYSAQGQLLLDKPFDYPGRGWDRFSNTMNTIDKVSNTIGMIEGLALSGAALGIGVATNTGREAVAYANSVLAPELAYHDLAKNDRAAKYYIGLKRLAKDKNIPGSFFVRRDKTAKANYLSYVSKTDGSVIFDIPLAEDAKNPEFSINEATGFVYYAPQFIDPNNSNMMMVFNKEKYLKAQQNNQLGFVAAYKLGM